MKHDLSERLSNKRRQLYWDVPRYRQQVARFFGWWSLVRRHAATFGRTIGPAGDTLMVFALPVAAALAVLAVLAAAFAGAMFAVSVAVSGVLAVWLVVIDTAHVPAILALRAVEGFRRKFQRKNVYVCPYCHSDLWTTRHRVPGYLCTHGERHFFVRPSTWGLLSHVAECGCRIGTLAWRKNAVRSDMQLFCPKCAGSNHTRTIGVADFGELPHVSVAVIGLAGDDGSSQFLREAWGGLENSNVGGGARVQVRYADRGSLPEFEDVAGVSAHSNGHAQSPRRRKPGTWVWRVQGSQGESLLYLHQSDMSWYGAAADDDHQREKAFEGVSGIVLVAPVGASPSETEAAIGAARIVLANRFAKLHGKLPIPLAVIVAGSEAPFRNSVDDHVTRLVESNFTPVKYFGGGPEQGAGAIEWTLRRCRGVAVV